MQRLTLFMIIVVTTFDFLSNGDRFGNGGFLPSQFSYFSELTGALAMAYVIIVGTRDRFRFVRPAYWIAFGTILMIVVIGCVVNGTGSGPIIAGTRTYLRAIPWFFVPAIFSYSDDQLRQQLKLLMLICLIQVPLAIRQRMQTADPSWGFVAITGDWTIGTMGDSGILSVFLVCSVCIVAAMYERKQLSLVQFMVLFFALLTPTMINETKAMVVFLPVGLMAAFLTAANPAVRLKRIVSGVLLLVMFGAMFVPVYDALNADREYGQSIGDFVSSSDSIEAYVSSGSEIGGGKEAGRGDAVVVPLRALAEDPVTLAFGYGIGNASDSSLGAGFGGKYAALFRPFLQTSFAKFVLELGVAGVGLVLLMYWMIFGDARAVARADRGVTGSIAAGWTGITLIMTASLFYNKSEVFPCITYMFWYFSGVIVAKRMRLAVAAAQDLKQPMSVRATVA